MKLLFLAATMVFLTSVLLARVSTAVPLKELRRRARAKDSRASAVYRAAAYGRSLEIFLWFVGVLSLATATIMAADAAWWAGLAVLIGGAGVFFTWHPARKTESWPWGLAAAAAPAAAGMLSRLHPLSGRAGEALERSVKKHSGLYEKEDLLEFLEVQSRQADNRISPEHLRAVKGALIFPDKIVRDVMIPRRKVKFVSDQDPVGPLLMDELHASGHKYFPVISGPVKTASPKIVGTLCLKDLVGYSGTGKVADLMKRERYFINDSQALNQALDAVLKTHHHLLLVVDDFEEIVGALTLEDILKPIIGTVTADEFDKYDDVRSVAGLGAKKEHKPVQGVKSPEQT